MFQRKKGEYGYLKMVKKQDLIKLLIYFLIAVSIFVLGLFLNKMSHKNIFTIVAILFVLPWARILVEYILLFPFDSPSREDYERLQKILPGDVTLVSDVVITSEKKAMGLEFLIIGNGYVYGISKGNKEQDLEIQNYLQTGIATRSKEYRVTICSGIPAFEKKISKEKGTADIGKREEVESFLYSLMV